MVVLVTSKNEKDLITNGGARVPKTLYFNFSDTQGKLTTQSVFGSGRTSNSSKLLWLSSLPARIKKIKSNMKMHIYPIYYPNIYPDAQGQVTPESVVGSGRNWHDFIVVLLTCKNEENPIEKNGARVLKS